MIELEKDVEKYLVRRVEALGGRCLKWTSPGTTGLPDRIVLLPGGRVVFVETKRPKGSRVEALQKYWCRVLRGLGFPHYFAYTQQAVDGLLEMEDRRA
jgi:hypothetical protein